jgi:MFS family permease
MFLMGAVLAGYVYFISLYLQKVVHFSPLLTGLALIPATLTVMVTSMLLTRRLLARYGTTSLMVGGLVSLAVGQLWLSSIDVSGHYAINVLGGLLCTAFGIGIIFPTASVAATARVAPSERGLAGGLFVTSLQVGQAVGLAALATLAAARTQASHGDLVAGYRLSFIVTTGFVAVALCVVLFSRRANHEVAAQ